MELRATKNLFLNDFQPAEVDSIITFPCYKSLDEYIDVEYLRSLDSYLVERIKHHIKTKSKEYFVNLHRLDAKTPYQPGVKEIWLSRTKEGLPIDYFDLVNKSEAWKLSEVADDFILLLDFIETLPFHSTGRMIIFYDDTKKSIPPHRDHLNTDVCHEFIWFRTNLKKPFYMLNEKTNEKKYVETYSAWFDAVNQYHGCDGAEGLSFSIRVDGQFTGKFRELIPKPQFNQASTAAFWACQS